MNPTYRPREFAKRAGVTIRALHHYDRIGLLKPSGRTAAGYRVYSDRDFARLEQIVALKFIGFPLFQIREILQRKDNDLSAALRQQRQIMVEKRDHLDRAVQAIDRAEKDRGHGRRTGLGAIPQGHRGDSNANQKRLDEKIVYRGPTRESPPAFVARGADGVGKRLGRAGSRYGGGHCERHRPSGRNRLAIGCSPRQKLLAMFTGGDPGIEQNLRKLYADKANWPASFKKPYSDAVWIRFSARPPMPWQRTSLSKVGAETGGEYFRGAALSAPGSYSGFKLSNSFHNLSAVAR